jgi:5,6-dimethylbenzimidazole synthase
VYWAICERPGCSSNFLPTPIPNKVLTRLLNAAHHAGCVGFKQPWEFVIISTRETKSAVKQLFETTNEAAALRTRNPAQSSIEASRSRPSKSDRSISV